MEVFPEEKDAEKKEASFGNVRQQVNAPRTYTADFSETLPVEGSDREMILHVKADVLVEVPEAEAIRLKKAAWATADEAVETAKNWERVFGKGTEGTLLEIEDGRTCEILVETEEGPYRVSDFTGNGEYPDSFLSYTLDWTKLELDKEGFRYLEDGKMLEAVDKTQQQEQEEISTLLAEAGLDMFQIRPAEPVVTRWAETPGEAVAEDQVSIGHFFPVRAPGGQCACDLGPGQLVVWRRPGQNNRGHGRGSCEPALSGGESYCFLSSWENDFYLLRRHYEGGGLFGRAAVSASL